MELSISIFVTVEDCDEVSGEHQRQLIQKNIEAILSELLEDMEYFEVGDTQEKEVTVYTTGDCSISISASVERSD